MQWVSSDLKKYVQAKEYIDTFIVPLFPISFSNDQQMIDYAYKSEVLSILVNELERELHGRIIVSPTYNYLTLSDRDKEIDRLNDWIEDSGEQSYKHTFFITNDSSWKKDERKLKGSLLWIPSIQSIDIESEEMGKYIRDQVQQMIELLKSFW